MSTTFHTFTHDGAGVVGSAVGVGVGAELGAYESTSYDAGYEYE